MQSCIIFLIVCGLFGDKVKLGDFDNFTYVSNDHTPVSAAVKLDCDFDARRPCCWAPGVTSSPVTSALGALGWRLARGEVPAVNFQHNYISTDPNNAYPPKGDFIVAVSATKRDAEEKALFTSCPFCAEGIVSVTLRHWNTLRVKLDVCWNDASTPQRARQGIRDGTFLSTCQNIGSEYSPGLTTLQFEAPRDKIIQVVFVARNFIQKNGGGAMIDDVEIRAKLCGRDQTESIQLWAEAEEKTNAERAQTGSERYAASAAELAQLAASVARQTEAAIDADAGDEWEDVGYADEDDDALSALVAGGAPDGFEYVPENIYENPSEDTAEKTEVVRQPLPALPPATTRPPTVATTTTQAPIPGEPCAVRAGCSFESGTLCHYRHTPGSQAFFTTNSGRVGGRLAGFSRAAEGSKYLVTKTKQGETATIEVDLEGSLINQDFDVVFKAYEASNQQTLRGCCEVEGEASCLFSTDLGVSVQDRQWQDAAFTCPAGTTKVRFQCENVGRFLGICALDDIRIYDTTSAQKQIC